MDSWHRSNAHTLWMCTCCCVRRGHAQAGCWRACGVRHPGAREGHDGEAEGEALHIFGLLLLLLLLLLVLLIASVM
jgi:hypothetical protein